jgi:RNA polymerase sigma-70 factor (ECF subfamily)
MQETSFLQYIDGLFRYAMVLSRNRSEADDLVQETYVRALAGRKDLRSDSNLKSWLFTILRNLWLNQLRKRRRTPEQVQFDEDEGAADVPAAASGDPHAARVTAMAGEQVRQAIEQLPVHFREVILLREYEELSYDEMAAMLGVPAGTVMSRLARARSRLRSLLSVASNAFSSPRPTKGSNEQPVKQNLAKRQAS